MICHLLLILLVKTNIVQVVKKEELDLKTGRYEVIEMYPERVMPKEKR